METRPLGSESDNLYNLTNYRYHLPPELIAQHPADPRDSSRLLVVDRRNGKMADKYFRDVVQYLQPGDALVINRSRVIPARLYVWKDTGARIELLLLAKRGDTWEALVKPARRVKAGNRLRFGDEHGTEVEVLDDLDLAGGRLVKFVNCPDEDAFIEQVGNMPLPPYINRPAELKDKETYQTVYAREAGSAAAPTAGLHFTDQLLQEIRDQGINIAEITLHVGLGTFRPVNSQDIRQHHMHYEYYQVSETTAALLNRTRWEGRSIVAVGTTVVRTMETVCNKEGIYLAQAGETNRFIYPGYEIKAVDKLITNFHLPGSSLLMLVSAMAGTDNTMQAYHHAVANRYRFFSYGDAMLIL